MGFLDPKPLTPGQADARYASKTDLASVTLVSDTMNLAAFGDSLTATSVWIDELIRLQPGITIYNGGRSGQSSSEIAMRQGGLVPKVTVSGGTIPSSGSVAVTVDYPTGAFKSNVQGAMVNPEYVGTIAGVPGKLVANIQGTPRTWSFTRATPGTAVPASGQRYFISTEGPLQVRKEQILWTGRNFSYDRVITDTADMVAYLRRNVIDPAFTVVSVINGSSEPIGTAEYNAILSRNATLKDTYGAHYCEVRRPLIDSGLAWAGITPTAGDQADIANDTVPRSLQTGDGFHLNSTGQKFVAKLIAEHRTRLGYDRTGPIVAASVNANPVDPDTPSTITATGVIRRYLAKTLDESLIGTQVTSLPDTSGVGSPLIPVVSGSGATLMNESGMDFLRFDGVDDRMYTAVSTTAQPFTVAYVYRMRTTGASKAIGSLNTGTPASPIMRREANGDLFASAGTGLTLAGAAADTGWHLAYASVNGGTSIIGVDGTTTTGAMGANSISGLRIGQGATDYSDIDVAEVILFNRALSAAELTQLRTDVKTGHPALP